MTGDLLRDQLFSKGYKYLLLDNIESSDDGSAILHYELLDEIPIEKCIDDLIALDSKLGGEIIQQSINGYTVIWVGSEYRYFVNSSGRIFRDQKFKKL